MYHRRRGVCPASLYRPRQPGSRQEGQGRYRHPGCCPRRRQGGPCWRRTVGSSVPRRRRGEKTPNRPAICWPPCLPVRYQRDLQDQQRQARTSRPVGQRARWTAGPRYKGRSVRRRRGKRRGAAREPKGARRTRGGGGRGEQRAARPPTGPISTRWWGHHRGGWLAGWTRRQRRELSSRTARRPMTMCR